MYASSCITDGCAQQGSHTLTLSSNQTGNGGLYCLSCAIREAHTMVSHGTASVTVCRVETHNQVGEIEMTMSNPALAR